MADCGHRLSKHISCKDRAVSEVTFLNHHILPSPCLHWLVPFHLCRALRHLSLHSSLPALPSLAHSLTIKLTNVIGHFSPALLSLFFFIFSVPPCHHCKLSCLACSLVVGFPSPFSSEMHPSVKTKKREKALLSHIFSQPWLKIPLYWRQWPFPLFATTLCDTDMVVCILGRARIGLPSLRICTKCVVLLSIPIVHTNTYVEAESSVLQHHLKIAMLPKTACEQIPHLLTFARRSHLSSPPHEVHPRQSLLASLPLPYTLTPQFYFNMTHYF